MRTKTKKLHKKCAPKVYILKIYYTLLIKKNITGYNIYIWGWEWWHLYEGSLIIRITYYNCPKSKIQTLGCTGTPSPLTEQTRADISAKSATGVEL